MNELFSNFADLSLFTFRIAIGAVFIVHGLSKKTAWENQEINSMTYIMRILFFAETLGGLALIAGLLTPLAAFGLLIVMLGAIYMKKSKWHMPFTTQSGTGWELDLVIASGCLMLMAFGGGSISFDNFLF